MPNRPAHEGDKGSHQCHDRNVDRAIHQASFLLKADTLKAHTLKAHTLDAIRYSQKRRR